jgi:hypothetical protein
MPRELRQRADRKQPSLKAQRHAVGEQAAPVALLLAVLK